MREICLYLHIHQPYRFRAYSVFEISSNTNYFFDPNYNSKQSNERIFRKVSEKSYRPTFSLLEKMLKENKKFKFSLSITGTWLEQAEMWEPEQIGRASCRERV